MMKYLLQATWLLNDTEFIERLALSSESIVFVSCCPWRRKAFAKNKKILVINPFKGQLYGSFSDGNKRPHPKVLLWIDQWPSLMSERFRELRFFLFSEYATIYMSQSFALKKEREALKDFFFAESLEGDFQVLWRERLTVFPRLSAPHEVKGFFRGFDSLGLSGGMLLDDPRKWPTSPQPMLFIPFFLEEHSYLYALGHRHQVAAMASFNGRSLRAGLLYWLWGHQRCREVRSGGENKNRGNSYSQSAVSRSAHYWDTFIEKWANPFRSFLRRSGWWKKA